MLTRRTPGRLAALMVASVLPISLACAQQSLTNASMERVQSLSLGGKLLEAREVLVVLLDRETDEAQRKSKLAALASLNQRIARADPLEISLERAELALRDEDLATARRHAAAVARSAVARETQVGRASSILAKVDERARALAPAVGDMVQQVADDYERGRHAEARAGIEAIHRSGVELSQAQAELIGEYAGRLAAQLAVDGSGAPGAVQPGDLRRRDESLPQPERAGQPAGQEDLVTQALRREVEGLLSRADAAFQQSRYNEARGLYDEALSSAYSRVLAADERARAEARRNESILALQGKGQEGVIDDELAMREIQRQAAQAEFNNYLQQAEAALREGRVEDARQQRALASLTASSNRGVFSAAENENFQRRLDALQASIVRRQDEIEQSKTAQRDAELRKTEQQRVEEARQERTRRVNELIDRARAFQAELRYEEALQTVEQLLLIDPNNPAGLLLKPTYEDILLYRRYYLIQDRKQLGYAIQSIENEDASIPPPGIVNYPSDWPRISQMRGEGVSFAQSPEDRRVLASLQTKPVPKWEFRDNALEDALTFVQTVTQLNMDVDWSSLDKIGISKSTPVSLSLTSVSTERMLNLLMEKTSEYERADWAVRDGVVRVASKRDLDRDTELAVYDIKDLLLEIPDYDEVPEIDLQSVLQSSGQGGGGGGQSPFRNDQQTNRNDQQRRERQEKMDDIIDIITQHIDSESWVDNGGEVGTIQQLTNQGSLIIVQTPKNHRQIQGLLSKLRELSQMQINVETRFLLVNQDYFEQIGFDLDIYLNANNNQVRAGQAITGQTQASDFFDNGRLRRGAGFQPGPVDVNQSGTVGDDFREGSVPLFGGRPAPWSPIGITGNSLGLTNQLVPASDFASQILGAAPALGIAGQFLDDIQVDFLVQATQADRRSIQLTAPRLTFTNGQTSNIYVVTQQAFISDLEVVTGDSAVGFDPTSGVVAEGVTLLVEGTVTSDRRYVTMNIDAGVARIDGFATETVTAVAGGQLVNSAEAQAFIQLPTITVTRVRTSVTVPDQGTILLGGQRLVTEFEVETGVPVLSKIPILNRFFTNRIQSKEEQTLLILVKPTILIQSENEERAYPGLRQLGFGG